MARSESITKEMVTNAAFGLLKASGSQGLTARKLAAALNCSTQPVFRLYHSMEFLTAELAPKCVEAFADYYRAFPDAGEMPFLNLGLAYICFAKEESQLFRILFLSKDIHKLSLLDILNGQTGAANKEMAKLKAAGCKEFLDVFMKMWATIHGLACMVLTGEYDFQDMEVFKKETTKLIESAYKAFMAVAK